MTLGDKVFIISIRDKVLSTEVYMDWDKSDRIGTITHIYDPPYGWNYSIVTQKGNSYAVMREDIKPLSELGKAIYG